MESKNLGNKTKIIKLMSNVGKYGLIIITCNKMHAGGDSHKIAPII